MDFRRCFARLPPAVRAVAKKNYALWTLSPQHRSLQYKCVNKTLSIYSIRVGADWRALGYADGDTITWFWIGSHAEYDKILDRT